MSMLYVGAGIAVVSLIGSGISFYAQQQQASSAESVANYNFEMQKRNNEQNKKIAERQQVWQQQAFANNQATTARNAAQARAVAQANANASNQNAAILANQGRAAESIAREEARRKRQENDKVLALQRGRYAKSGVTNEGTPLSIMAETAGLLELSIQDAAYQADMTGRAFDRKADLARFEGRTALYEGALAGVDSQESINQSVFDAGVSRYEAAAKEAGFAIQLNQARIDQFAGLSTAKGLRTASYGTLLSGVGEAAASGASIYKTYKDQTA